MSVKPKVMVIGDVHGDWPFLNLLINQKRPDIVLACGDFGWWPRFHDTYEFIQVYSCYGRRRKKWLLFDAIKNRQCPIYFAPGNHEDWDDLDRREKSGETEVQPNVFYKPKGSTLTLPDGRNVLFFGGAEPRRSSPGGRSFVVQAGGRGLCRSSSS